MKPETEWQARVWGNIGRLTPDQSVAAIREIRGDAVILNQHPAVKLPKKKGKR